MDWDEHRFVDEFENRPEAKLLSVEDKGGGNGSKSLKSLSQ
jgi:hypothetical protein